MKRRVRPNALVTSETRIRAANRKRVGDRLERLLEHGATAYRHLTWHDDGTRYRTADHRSPPVAVLSRVHPRVAGAPGRMRIVEKGTVDFVGQVRQPPFDPARGIGRIMAPVLPLAFDAKSVSGGEASFAVDPAQWHQLAYLADVAAGGGLAGYLLEDARERRAWWIGGPQLAVLQQGHRVKFRRLATAPDAARAHTVESLVPTVAWGLLPGTALQGYDWLPLVLAAAC